MTDPTPSFRTNRPPARKEFLSLRVSEEQKVLLGAVADRLGIGVAELLRLSVEYYLDNDPAARRARREATR